MLRVWAFVWALVCFALPAAATTYLPVTFDELVARADVIFVGDVVDVRPFALETRDGTVIKTRVTFRVRDPLLGTTSALEVFDFLGGEIDGVTMKVAEMPTFTVGDRRVMFARRERSINPVVGFSQGVFEVRRDAAGVDRILTDEGVPVATPDAIGRRPDVMLTPVAPMRLSDFRSRIARALTEARTQ
jgi:hypothetical protein